MITLQEYGIYLSGVPCTLLEFFHFKLLFHFIQTQISHFFTSLHLCLQLAAVHDMQIQKKRHIFYRFKESAL